MRAIIAALVMVAAAMPAGAQPIDAVAAQPRVPEIVQEAEAFMAAYARELAAGDRAAVGARYDRRGAYLQGFAGDVFNDQPDIAAFYASTEWEPPRAFAWQNLRYEQVGPGAVMVVGRFLWTPATGAPLTASYTALLVRDGRALRIRMEHESAVAPPASQAN